MSNPNPAAKQRHRDQKLTDNEDWVEVSKDVDWHDAAEDLPNVEARQPRAANNTEIKKISVLGLLKEFALNWSI